MVGNSGLVFSREAMEKVKERARVLGITLEIEEGADEMTIFVYYSTVGLSNPVVARIDDYLCGLKNCRELLEYVSALDYEQKGFVGSLCRNIASSALGISPA